ncbi:MAG TPA: peptide chain release factor 3 [Acidiferrobacteraceae bacterium]|nr:peptide chain release factor 3 [Acidiferrobacteraceae bacterium]
MSTISAEASRRRTFAIISHPDAGKTTLTEKLLLFGGAINMAGTIKGRKSARYATSDWMELERQRGISVTSSVMQFEYADHVVNLLDTPGHEDFSEDTYRTLTAVDSAIMVIDLAKGVEPRTIKLLEICRSRSIPIIAFINKLDREGREPMEVLDEIERLLALECAPITWPIGTGRAFAGIYHLYQNRVRLFSAAQHERAVEGEIIEGNDRGRLRAILDERLEAFEEELALVQQAAPRFNQTAYREGYQAPVFFGSALNNFGVRELLEGFVEYAPAPAARASETRMVLPDEPHFSGFVFKIQANMDPLHRDRIAFVRVCSGRYERRMKLRHVRLGRDMQAANALTFMARDRTSTDEAYAGDIIGLPNHGTLRIGDALTDGEPLRFPGVPSFAPELFRRAQLRNPMKAKQLLKGLEQLTEEGATQLFRPLSSNDLILGAVGTLQFDVVAYRLQAEYGVDALFEAAPVVIARWVRSEDPKKLDDFIHKMQPQLARDSAGELAYLAPSRVNLDLAMERWPDIQFVSLREQQR